MWTWDDAGNATWDASATDPTFNIDDYIQSVAAAGGTGVAKQYDPANYPTETEIKNAIETGTSNNSFLSDVISNLGNSAKGFLSKYLVDSNGKVNLGGLGTAAAALSMLNGGNKTITNGGYNKPIPKYDAVRQQVANVDPNRRPGSSGLQYFTNQQYVTQGDAGALAAAQAASDAQKQGILAARPVAPVPAPNPYEGKLNTAALTTTAINPTVSAAPTNQMSSAQPLPVPQAQLTGGLKMAQGGLTSFAEGGSNYLQGSTDGMADKLNTSIDDKQAAKLSHGEFVIPADVVSHLGNGNSDAGAQRLYDMMAKIRKARTGNPEQGKRIDPNKFMPGGLAQYANGGAVAFVDGGLTVGTGANTSAATANTANANTAAVTPASTSTQSALSPYAGEYVTNYLGKGEALANQPYQAYQGPLTAGTSDLQNQAFAGASQLAGTGYSPTQFTTSTFDTNAANQYMNPYLQASLDPQLKELQRQSQINNMTNAGKLTQAGAYGGSRQAILTGEENRNLLDKSQGLIGQGYNTAYNNAMNQFNADQNRGLTAQQNTEASRQYGTNETLQANQNLAQLGNQQRDITQQGIAADKAQFEEQRDNPYKMVQYQKDLLTGLPITTNTNSTNTTDYANLVGSISDLKGLYNNLSNLAVTPSK
jgi:hypothetical protein